MVDDSHGFSVLAARTLDRPDARFGAITVYLRIVLEISVENAEGAEVPRNTNLSSIGQTPVAGAFS